MFGCVQRDLLLIQHTVNFASRHMQPTLRRSSLSDSSCSIPLSSLELVCDGESFVGRQLLSIVSLLCTAKLSATDVLSEAVYLLTPSFFWEQLDDGGLVSALLLPHSLVVQACMLWLLLHLSPAQATAERAPSVSSSESANMLSRSSDGQQTVISSNEDASEPMTSDLSSQHFLALLTSLDAL